MPVCCETSPGADSTACSSRRERSAAARPVDITDSCTRGSRYVVTDPTAARECIQENLVLRRIAAAVHRGHRRVVVATADDPDDYADAFPTACEASGIPCDEVSVAELLRREPAVAKTVKRAFFVPDASLHAAPLLTLANVDEARQRGSDVWPDHRLESLRRDGDRIVGGQVRDQRTGEPTASRRGPSSLRRAPGPVTWPGSPASCWMSCSARGRWWSTSRDSRAPC